MPMRRLQLFGRKKCRVPKEDLLLPVPEHSPSLGFLDFPKDVLSRILKEVDTNTLLNLCQVHSRLYELITNEFLYKNVKLETKFSLLKFNVLIHSEFRTSNVISRRNNTNADIRNARFLVQSIEFKDPQCHDSLLKYSKYQKGGESLISGSYLPEADSTSRTKDKSKDKGDESTSKYIRYTYIELMVDIIDYLPNLRHIILSHVQAGFRVPLWYSVFNDGSRDFFKKIIRGQQSMTSKDLRSFEISSEFLTDYQSKFYSLPRIKTLEIRAAKDEEGKNQVALRYNLLCCFGVIDQLILGNVIIDTESLDTPMEFIPFHLRLENSGIYDLNSTVTSLTLKSCTIIPGNGILRLVHDYFRCVKSLELLDLTSKYDMLICSCFGSLADLTIDCNSHCFINEKLVKNSYYQADETTASSEIDHDFDCDSLTETLLDLPLDQNDHGLLAPPPTTPVVLSLNLGYLSRNPGNHPERSKKQIALITKSQNVFFNQLGIPKFHTCYHYYKQLWDRLPRKSINVNIINIPFTNVYPLSPELYCEKMISSMDDDQQTLISSNSDTSTGLSHYYWDEPVRNCIKDRMHPLPDRGQYDDLTAEEILQHINDDAINNFKNFKGFQDIPNVNLWCFLKSLSKFKSVRIQMLRQWLFCTPRSRYDWELLLRPLLNVDVPVEVRDKDGFALYSYGSVRNAQL